MQTSEQEQSRHAILPQKTKSAQGAGGSLRLHPAPEIPRYHPAADGVATAEQPV